MDVTITKIAKSTVGQRALSIFVCLAKITQLRVSY